MLTGCRELVKQIERGGQNVSLDTRITLLCQAREKLRLQYLMVFQMQG